MGGRVDRKEEWAKLCFHGDQQLLQAGPVTGCVDVLPHCGPARVGAPPPTLEAGSWLSACTRSHLINLGIQSSVEELSGVSVGGSDKFAYSPIFIEHLQEEMCTVAGYYS